MVTKSRSKGEKSVQEKRGFEGINRTELTTEHWTHSVLTAASVIILSATLAQTTSASEIRQWTAWNVLQTVSVFGPACSGRGERTELDVSMLWVGKKSGCPWLQGKCAVPGSYRACWHFWCPEGRQCLKSQRIPPGTVRPCACQKDESQKELSHKVLWPQVLLISLPFSPTASPDALRCSWNRQSTPTAHQTFFFQQNSHFLWKENMT